MTIVKLSPEQLKELINAEKQIKQPQLLKRIQSIKLRDKGFSNLEIGEFLIVSDQTVSNWNQLYLKQGLEALLQWDYKGKVSILTLKQLQELRDYNAIQPFEKAAEAKMHIEEQYGHVFHLHWVQKLLKKNFNLHTKKQD
jgi:transposase